MIRRTCILLVMIFGMSCASFAQKIPSETWMGIYFDQTKIGYAKFNIEKAQFENRSAYRLDSFTNTHMQMLGIDVGQNIDAIAYLDKDFAPIYQIFRMSSAGHATTITARFKKKEILVELEGEGRKTTKRIPIPPGSKIVGDSTVASTNMKLKIGDKLDLKMFNPLTLTLDDLHTEVLRKEEIQLDGARQTAFVISSTTTIGDMICWQDENGEVLKTTGPMGIIMIRESQEVAKSMPESKEIYAPPSDLAVVTSAPTTTTISDPRHVKYLKVRLSGLTDRSLAISDERQKVTITGNGPFAGDYEITASEPNPSQAKPLPITDEQTAAYLKDTAYVQTADPEILKTSKAIIGDEKNSEKAALKLRSWVNTYLSAKGDIGILRSSVDILHNRTGVCRDYAILYASLARAAGIPTKLVAGLVFWQGRFYYHAWAESFTGEWIPIDATLQIDFVDATHIKLAEGDATAMFSIVKTMGSVKAAISEYR